MKNFIEVEKTDEEQAEQVKKWIKENTLQIIIGVALGLGGLWGFDYYKEYQQKQAMQARNYYLSIVANPNSSDASKTLKKNHANSTYVEHADLLMAKQAIMQESYQDALNYLLPLTSGSNEFVTHNAKLRTASVYLEMGDTDKALSVLGNNTNKAFEAFYNHIKGDIYFAKNNINAAKKHYDLALSQLDNNSKLKVLIQIKLNDLN